MRRAIIIALLIPGLTAANCRRPPVVAIDADEQERIREDLDRFQAFWLEPSRLPPPTIRIAEQEVRDGSVVGRAIPLDPEAQPWNQWPGESARLFNNRVAHLFAVRIEGAGDVRWLPPATRVEVNEPGDGIASSASADLLLRPLLSAALQQERWVLDGDLAARTGAAGPFRAAYLPEQAEVLDGVVAFPVPPDSDAAHIAALRLTLRVQDDKGVHDLVWVWE